MSSSPPAHLRRCVDAFHRRTPLAASCVAGFLSLALLGAVPARAESNTANNDVVSNARGVLKEFQGKVSYYGRELAGRLTANGERFDPQGLTMAHPSLPFGAWVRVTNLKNQQSVVVRVNDRGPFVGNRVADLSHSAARAIQMLTHGVVHARLEVLPGAPTEDERANNSSTRSAAR